VSTIGAKIATLCPPSQAATVERGCRQDPITRGVPAAPTIREIAEESL
jgi:hypothetical protein